MPAQGTTEAGTGDTTGTDVTPGILIPVGLPSKQPEAPATAEEPESLLPIEQIDKHLTRFNSESTPAEDRKASRDL